MCVVPVQVQGTVHGDQTVVHVEHDSIHDTPFGQQDGLNQEHSHTDEHGNSLGQDDCRPEQSVYSQKSSPQASLAAPQAAGGKKVQRRPPHLQFIMGDGHFNNREQQALLQCLLCLGETPNPRELKRLINHHRLAKCILAAMYTKEESMKPAAVTGGEGRQVAAAAKTDEFQQQVADVERAISTDSAGADTEGIVQKQSANTAAKKASNKLHHNSPKLLVWVVVCWCCSKAVAVLFTVGCLCKHSLGMCVLFLQMNMPSILNQHAAMQQQQHHFLACHLLAQWH